MNNDPSSGPPSSVLAAPELSLADLWQYAPLLLATLDAVKAGAGEVPAIKIRTKQGWRTIGPTPIHTENL